MKQPTQRAKFEKLASDADCDLDEAAFEKKLKRIVSTPPPKDEKPKPRESAGMKKKKPS